MIIVKIPLGDLRLVIISPQLTSALGEYLTSEG